MDQPQLEAFTKKFGNFKGTKYAVGCDSHEARFHAKFASAENSTRHVNLLNLTQGNKIPSFSLSTN
jgi:hypothetical protein